MAEFLYRISGEKKVYKAFRALPPKLQKRVLRPALRKAARPLQARVKQLAPLGATGQVRRNVKIRAGKRTRKGSVRINVQIGEQDFTGDQFYAAFVNLGTKRSGVGGKGKGTRRPGQPAQAFMQRAKQETEPQVRRIAEDEIRKGVEREAKG